ncbi:tol-pal system YbgF family protein [Streptomyces sp. NPDC004134]|uniref:tetratricopeptide repeat protein n=1 Tax=Streptomyces sp. NPDC004134 TaxID=3364691 RepID=UPI003696617D
METFPPMPSEPPSEPERTAGSGQQPTEPDILASGPGRPVFEPAPVPVRARDPYAVGLANASLLGIGYGMLRKPRIAVGTAGVSVMLVILLATAGRNAWFQAVVLAWWIGVTVHGWYLAGGRLPRRGAAAPGALPQATEAQPTEPARPAVAAHGAEPGPGPADAPPPPAAPPVLPANVRRDRLIALLVAAPVLLACTALRLDASRIEGNAADAHRAGECDQAVSDLDGLWFGHRLADAPLTARAEDSTEACELLLKAESESDRHRLRATRTLQEYAKHPAALWKGADDRRADLILAEAGYKLEAGLTGDANALSAGFGHLGTVLDEFTGKNGGKDRSGDVDEALDEFLGALPTDDACQTGKVADWLAQRESGDDALDRAADVVPEVAPAALVGCGDALMADGTWEEARTQYRQLLDEYPGHELAGASEDGIERADLAIQLDQVRGLLSGAGGGKPEYCDNPAPYRGAKPYRGGGPHRAMLYGQNKHRSKLPSSWKAQDAKDAVVVICAGETDYGATVATCPYEYGPGNSKIQNVSFKNRSIPVRVYELRTGKLVEKTSVEIGGSSCPALLPYTYYDIDTGPPSEVYVTSSKSDVRAGYESLIHR